MTTQVATRTRRRRTVELGRYVTERGERRVLVGKRGGDGVVRIYDLPVDPPGRIYLVEEGFGSWAEVAALRRDYLRQAGLIGECPMGRNASRRS
jgi:hypothetical protein